ncbi:hypothetical protein H8N03_13920 [Ramlibacter sp. USB13]|uniref:Uncharacterized protein n=1 Tax=Ramlibacter cellulosilyticus TaxID=2764187 RepID=A0A923SBN8_9BURK|nr:hypothetical protein [Ramlibacter cellulosilyticus]MBC5784044.1 hypothetical protein [Ramlibacter cellulosilyticus]
MPASKHLFLSVLLAASAAVHAAGAGRADPVPKSPVLGPPSPNGVMGGTFPSAIPPGRQGEGFVPQDLPVIEHAGRIGDSPVLGPKGDDGVMGGTFPSVLAARGIPLGSKRPIEEETGKLHESPVIGPPGPTGGTFPSALPGWR